MGLFFTTITPDMYNDLKVTKNLIWSDIEIDTVKENIYISNIDPAGAIEIETKITEFMMAEKKKYGQKSSVKWILFAFITILLPCGVFAEDLELISDKYIFII